MVQLYTGTDEKTESELGSKESFDATEKSEAARTSGGPDMTAEPDKSGDKAKPDAKDDKSKSDKDAPAVDAELVIKALEESKKGEQSSKGHNIDKGLQKAQDRIGQLERQGEKTNEALAQITELLQKANSKQGLSQDEVDVLQDVSDDDFVDGKTIKKSLKALTNELKKTVDAQSAEIKELLKARPQEQSKLSDAEVRQSVEGMFPELKEYAGYMIQQAGPAMQQYQESYPKATQAMLQDKANSLLSAEAQNIKMAIIQNGGKSDSADKASSGKTKKAPASTNIVDSSASPATTANDGSGPMLSMQDAIEKHSTFAL